MKTITTTPTAIEDGSASIFLDLSYGEITVYRGEPKNDEDYQTLVLQDWNTEGKVQEGTWTKVLEAIKNVVEENIVQQVNTNKKENENENE